MYYYHLDSNGDAETNLQLYSLKQAKKYWAALECDVSEGGYIHDLHERCVFVVCTIGLSVSQLLGQNAPEPHGSTVPNPSRIFSLLVDQHGMDQSLKSRFREFVDAYDQCRHFGRTTGDVRHQQVSQVDFQRARDFYEFGLTVWRVVIGIYRSDPSNELDGFDLHTIEDES